MQRNMTRHPATADIEQNLAQTLGQRLTLDTWQAVSGGSIHQAYHVISQDKQHFFIKINQASKMHTLTAEAQGLIALHQALNADSPLRIPKVIGQGSNTTHVWLILEYIPFGRSDAASQTKLGQGLALLHQHTAPQFGFDSDNVIGASLQTNTWTDDWLTFWAEQRLGTQFQLAKQHGFYDSFASETENLLDALPKLLQNHQPSPSLLHGDLWGGNAAADANGKPMIFDPAVYYGDRECDLAMTELFGGFSTDFYAAYDDVYPLSDGYAQRKMLYNLYHILNHANLFGSAYIMQSKSMMQQLVQRIS